MVNMTFETIKYKDKIYAYVIRGDEKVSSTKFYSPKDSDIQFGIVSHEKGYIEPAHRHKPVKRIIESTIETLHITSGKTQINFYEDYGGVGPNLSDLLLVKKVILKKGDTILLLGDRIHQLVSPWKFSGIKTKQGPYINLEEDKILYDTCE
jgi:hypothetical protein